MSFPPRRPGVATSVFFFLLLAVMLFAPQRLAAQGIGLELGWAGVENHDPVEFSFGLTGRGAMGEAWTGALTYAQWTGDLQPGPRAFTAAALYRLLGDERAAWSLGGGATLYERSYRDRRSGTADDWRREYRTAITLSNLWSYPVTSSVRTYVRGDISFARFGGSWPRPLFGFLRAGVEVVPW